MKKRYYTPKIEITNISIEDICQASKFYFGDKINDYEAQGEWIW